MQLNQIEHEFRRPDAMNAEYLIAMPRAPLKHMHEHFLLEIERTIVAGASVNPYFSYISSLRQVLIPQ